MKRNHWKSILLLAALSASFLACESSQQRLPILGNTDYREVNGTIDTVYHTIPDFAFLDQDSAMITKETARVSRKKYHFVNDKVKKALDFEFRPVEESIEWSVEGLKSKNNL